MQKRRRMTRAIRNLNMKELNFHLVGKAPLILHNGQLSDPLNYHSQRIAEIASKRKKTIKDLEELAHREWIGSLYWDDEIGVYIPGANIERMLRDAAAKSKDGKSVQAGCIVEDDSPLIYNFDGEKTVEGLWESQQFFSRDSCKVGQSRVIRTRPCFEQWELQFTVTYDPEIVNATKIKDFVSLAGKQIGLGDWRPKHGRFELVKKRS